MPWLGVMIMKGMRPTQQMKLCLWRIWDLCDFQRVSMLGTDWFKRIMNGWNQNAGDITGRRSSFWMGIPPNFHGFHGCEMPKKTKKNRTYGTTTPWWRPPLEKNAMVLARQRGARWICCLGPLAFSMPDIQFQYIYGVINMKMIRPPKKQKKYQWVHLQNRCSFTVWSFYH